MSARPPAGSEQRLRHSRPVDRRRRRQRRLCRNGLRSAASSAIGVSVGGNGGGGGSAGGVQVTNNGNISTVFDNSDGILAQSVGGGGGNGGFSVAVRGVGVVRGHRCRGGGFGRRQRRPRGQRLDVIVTSTGTVHTQGDEFGWHRGAVDRRRRRQWRLLGRVARFIGTAGLGVGGRRLGGAAARRARRPSTVMASDSMSFHRRPRRRSRPMARCRTAFSPSLLAAAAATAASQSAPASAGRRRPRRFGRRLRRRRRQCLHGERDELQQYSDRGLRIERHFGAVDRRRRRQRRLRHRRVRRIGTRRARSASAAKGGAAAGRPARSPSIASAGYRPEATAPTASSPSPSAAAAVTAASPCRRARSRRRQPQRDSWRHGRGRRAPAGSVNVNSYGVGFDTVPTVGDVTLFTTGKRRTAFWPQSIGGGGGNGGFAIDANVSHGRGAGRVDRRRRAGGGAAAEASTSRATTTS